MGFDHRQRQRTSAAANRRRVVERRVAVKHRSKKTPQTKLRHSGGPAPRSWHRLAGKLPDGTLAAKQGVTRNVVRNYCKKMNISSFTRQGVRPEYEEVRCGS